MASLPNLITPLLLVLILCIAHTTSTAQRRPPPISSAPEIVKRRTMIGSRPPRCERRCNSCVRCEAIQVPIVPQHTALRPATRTQPLGSRGDNLSNYKPLSWKCKCGNFIFNP